ncbi:hypothetical protein RB200_07190 [Streptomyces sp. PmtG]
MSAKECLKGLGTNKKFYTKSRFAVCSGASFNQVWFINNQPSGESRINFIAVGTITKGSRTVKIRHHYRFEATGRTRAHGTILTPKATLPQKWPASARISEGGALPAGRTWASLAAEPNPGFTRTLTGKSGTGSGRDDALFAVFQPELKVTGGWTMTGPREGKPFLLAPRWDTAKYLAGSTADGGATFSYSVHMPFSTKAGAPERAAAQHIKDAYTKPEKTEPKNTRKNIPGRTAGKPLTRLYHDLKRRDDNRHEAIKACKAKWGANYSGAGSGPAGPVLSPHPGGVEGGHGRSEWFGDGVDTALASPDGEPFGLVRGQGQAAEGEEVLQRAGEGSHRPSGSAGSLQQGLVRRLRLALTCPGGTGPPAARGTIQLRT